MVVESKKTEAPHGAEERSNYIDRDDDDARRTLAFYRWKYQDAAEESTEDGNDVDDEEHVIV